MGEVIPPEEPVEPWPPDLVNDKYYRAGVGAYQHPYLPGCEGTRYPVSCCLLGWVINEWWTDELVCQNGWELCAFTGYSAQDLESIVGPYNTFALCASS